MRIVGGAFRGRSLKAPGDARIRPTADRTREALFNVIGHGFPGALDGSRVLDLFAGTGALGLEALSRGAASCLFVEESADARGLIRDNVEALGLNGRAKIFRRDATRLGEAGTIAPFSLLFADPPYGRDLGAPALAAALAGKWLAAEALCVVEEALGAPFAPPSGFSLLDARTYGDTVIRFLRVRDAVPRA